MTFSTTLIWEQILIFVCFIYILISLNTNHTEVLSTLQCVKQEQFTITINWMDIRKSVKQLWKMVYRNIAWFQILYSYQKYFSCLEMYFLIKKMIFWCVKFLFKVLNQLWLNFWINEWNSSTMLWGYGSVGQLLQSEVYL